MEKITFLNPEFFWLFLLIPVIVVWLFLKRNHQSATLKISSVEGFKGSNTLLVRLKPFLGVLRLLALSSLIVAMARPRTVDISNKTKTTKAKTKNKKQNFKVIAIFSPQTSNPPPQADNIRISNLGYITSY